MANGAAVAESDYYTVDFTKTINGGETWATGVVSGMPSTYQISNLSATNKDHAWVSAFNTSPSGSKGGIFETVDGGVNWARHSLVLVNSSSSFPNVVHFWNENDGWCMGDPADGYFELYTTTDGGDNWDRVPSENIPANIAGEYGYVGMYDVVGDIVWFGTNKGRMLKSVDKGLNWTVSETGVSDVNEMAFNDALNGFILNKVQNEVTAVVDSFTLEVTHDGGENWTEVNPSGNFCLRAMDAVPDYPGLFVSVGKNGVGQYATLGSSFSFDYGETWQDIDETVNYISTKFLNSDIGWAGSYALSSTIGGIFKWKESVLSIKDLVEEAKANNLTVYPNPSNGLVNVRLKNIESNNVNIEIIDITGRFVYSNNENLSNGMLNINIDLSNIDKGIYFVVATSNMSSSTQKIIIK